MSSKRIYREIPYTCIGCIHYNIDTCTIYDTVVSADMLACKEHFTASESYLVEYEQKMEQIYKDRMKRKRNKHKNR